MGSNVTKKLRKKVAVCINTCGHRKYGKSDTKFANYESVVSVALPGDIIEIKYGFIRHYVLLAKPVDDQYWCFHVQRLAHNHGYGVVRYEPLVSVLRDVFPDESPQYRVRNQQRLADKVLALTENAMPVAGELAPVLQSLQNLIVKFDENYCNCEHYVTLWRYGIGWSHVCNTGREILKTIKVFRQSLSQNILTHEFGVEISGDFVQNRECNVIIHCFGLYGHRLLDGIQYIMDRQKTLIKV